MTTVVQLAMTPPSLNRVGSRGAALAFHRQKKQWQKWLELLLMSSDLPKGCTQVHASAVLSFPVHRDRDEGNYRALLEKACGDALTAGGWLKKDTAAHYRFREVNFTKGPSGTTITLEYR